MGRRLPGGKRGTEADRDLSPGNSGNRHRRPELVGGCIGQRWSGADEYTDLDGYQGTGDL